MTTRWQPLPHYYTATSLEFQICNVNQLLTRDNLQEFFMKPDAFCSHLLKQCLAEIWKAPSYREVLQVLGATSGAAVVSAVKVALVVFPSFPADKSPSSIPPQWNKESEFWTQTALGVVSSNGTEHCELIHCLAFIYMYLLCNFIVSDAIGRYHLWNNGQQEWDEVGMLIADRANNISFECHQLIFSYSNAGQTWCQATIFCVDDTTVIVYLWGGDRI